MTATAILDAARDVLVEHGLHAPMELIASRAGVAVGTLYNHFSDRKTLIDALLEDLREQLREDLAAAAEANAEQPVKQQLQAMLAAFFDSWSLIFLIIKQGEQMPDAKKRAHIRQRITEQFGEVLDRGRREGILLPDTDGLYAVALQGLMHSVFSFAADEPKKVSRERAVELVTDLFFQGASVPRVKYT